MGKLEKNTSMDHKNSERTSAEKVIYGLIGEVDCLRKRLNIREYEFPHDTEFVKKGADIVE